MLHKNKLHKNKIWAGKKTLGGKVVFARESRHAPNQRRCAMDKNESIGATKYLRQNLAPMRVARWIRTSL
jgi:hypothetical protein